MTPNRGPVNKCSVKGCVWIGHWPAGGTCPQHREDDRIDQFLTPDENGEEVTCQDATTPVTADEPRTTKRTSCS